MAFSKKSREGFNEAFREALNGLNEQQRRAVELIDGPALVIAGPGTGKTHILSSRVGQILLETDAQAQNILCLTFTDAAVQAMRKRLLQFIGPEAHRVPIYTFHAFCNSIIQDNLELFGQQELEPVSELEAIELLRELLDELPPGSPLRRGRADAYHNESRTRHLLQMMKAEDWSYATVEQAVRAYLEALPEREGFFYKTAYKGAQPGDPKSLLIEQEQQKMERLLAAARLYEPYQDKLRKARRYDYDDMISWVLKAFREQPYLLRGLQERFLYILVDEYQDTNGGQNAIIRYLAEYWEAPNLFIVGDDDQSVYEFQGARLKNLIDIYEEYKGSIELIVLQDNYRSAQDILDAAGRLIRHNSIRAVNAIEEGGITKELTARHPAVAARPARPEVREFPNPFQELTWLADELQRLSEEGVPLSEVAVIYPRHRQSGPLIELLEKRQLPYTTRRRANALHLPMSRQVRLLLEYFALEFKTPFSGDHLLFQALHFNFFGLHPDDLATLSLAIRDSPAISYWRQALADEEWMAAFHFKDEAAIQRFLAFQDYAHRQYASLSAPAFLEQLVNRSGLLAHVLQQPDKAWGIQVLRSLLDFVKEEAARSPRLTVGGLLDLFRSMDDNRIALPVQEPVFQSEGVQLLTAHSSKGLEFRQVFLFDCRDKEWMPEKRGNRSFSLPDTLTYASEEDPLEARRRLFYVAATRAKERLHLSYPAADEKGKGITRSLFIDEMMSGESGFVQHQEVAPSRLLETEQLLLQTQASPVLQALPKEAVDAVLEGFQLSVSALNRFLKCPLAFYYEHILRAPVLMREAAHYGTAMHFAVERYFNAAHRGGGTKNLLCREFTEEMERRQGFFARRSYENRLAAGLHNLSLFYDAELSEWPTEVLTEFKPRQVEVANVPVHGSIDLVAYRGLAEAHVIDFKTGTQQRGRVNPPSDKDPLGGPYWRQLVFYKLLFEGQAGNTRRVAQGRIAYLEPDRNNRFKVEKVDIGEEDAMFVKALISDVYQRIMAHDFYTGCGEPDCSWCSFVRDSVVPHTFADPDLEALDDQA